MTLFQDWLFVTPSLSLFLFLVVGGSSHVGYIVDIKISMSTDTCAKLSFRVRLPTTLETISFIKE